jgi:hypothetical protein
MQPLLEFDSTLRWVGTVGEWSLAGKLDNLWSAHVEGSTYWMLPIPVLPEPAVPLLG